MAHKLSSNKPKLSLQIFAIISVILEEVTIIYSAKDEGSVKTWNAFLRSENKSKLFFKLRLCDDIFLDLLHFGIRCDLALLESIGDRFHHLIGRYFKFTPFLQLGTIYCNTRIVCSS